MVNVLLVEDDEFISDIIETKLTKAGLTVETTPDGNSVLQKIEQTEPDLVLLDLMLPNRHGFEILEDIRVNEGTKDLKVMILSNENGPDVEERAKALNAKYFFKAMTDMSELVTIVNGMLKE